MKQFFKKVEATRLAWVLSFTAISALISWYFLDINPFDRISDHFEEFIDWVTNIKSSWFTVLIATAVSTWINRSTAWSLLATLPTLLLLESGVMSQIVRQFPDNSYSLLISRIFIIILWIGIGMIFQKRPEYRKQIFTAWTAVFLILSFSHNLKNYGLGDTLRFFITGVSERALSLINNFSEEVFDDGVLTWIILLFTVFYILSRKWQTYDKRIWGISLGLIAFMYYASPAFQTLWPEVLKYRETDIVTLAKNIYHEVGSPLINPLEPEAALYAVAEVTMARMKANRTYFGGNTVKGVVYANKQFSWTLYSKARHAKMWRSKNPDVRERWKLSLQVAKNALAGNIPKEHKKIIEKIRHECVHYYKRTDDKGTSERGRSTFTLLTRVVDVGAHTFFKDTRVPCKIK